MRVIVLCCGTPAPAPLAQSSAEVHLLDEVPTRSDLRILDAAAKDILPQDPTPSLDEIQKRPDVPHLGTPTRAPQAEHLREPLRIIVHGTDASLSGVLTRLMRADALWAEVGFVPTDPQASAAAATWGLKGNLWSLALTGSVKPLPVVRTDKGLVVAGSAELTHAKDQQFRGEVIVDDKTLLLRTEDDPATPLHGSYGVRIVPTADQPGIAAAVITTSKSEKKWWQRFMPKGEVDAASMLSGRAVQTGGAEIMVTIDGVPAKRPVDRSTFYRHLRDLQAVR